MPDGQRRARKYEHEKPGVDKGQGSGSSDGHGAGDVEPQPQRKDRDQGGNYTCGQAVTLPFLRRAGLPSCASSRAMTACSSVLLAMYWNW